VSNELRDWTAGSAGYCILLIQASKVFNEPSWLELARDIAEHGIWARRTERRNLGLYRGLAGHGYVCLALSRAADRLKSLDATSNRQQPQHERLDHESLWYERAQYYSHAAAGNWGDLLDVQTSKNPFSLFEGLGGTACLLMDLETPSEAYFPLYEIPPNASKGNAAGASQPAITIATMEEATPSPQVNGGRGIANGGTPTGQDGDQQHASWRAKLFKESYSCASSGK